MKVTFHFAEKKAQHSTDILNVGHLGTDFWHHFDIIHKVTNMLQFTGE